MHSTKCNWVTVSNHNSMCWNLLCIFNVKFSWIVTTGSKNRGESTDLLLCHQLLHHKCRHQEYHQWTVTRWCFCNRSRSINSRLIPFFSNIRYRRIIYYLFISIDWTVQKEKLRQVNPLLLNNCFSPIHFFTIPCRNTL